MKGPTATLSLFNVFYSEGVDGNGGKDIMSISGQGKIGINTYSTGTYAKDGALSIMPPTSGVHNLSLLNYGGSQKWSFYVKGSLKLHYNGANRGNFNSTSGAYSSISDRRLKENITPVHNVLDQIKGVEVMRYTFKADESHAPQLGYVAQNLEEHFPEFVNRPDTTSDEENYYTVNYAGMSAVAIKAIQEQQAMIESLQQTMAKMRSRLDLLEK